MYYFVNKKNTVRFTHVLCDFILLFLCSNLQGDWKVHHKSHLNILVFYDQWKITPDLNMSHGKISDFFFIRIVRVHFNHKIEKFWFWKYWNTLRYTNADLKISPYVFVHIKAIPWKFCILNPNNSPVTWLWSLQIS